MLLTNFSLKSIYNTDELSRFQKQIDQAYQLLSTNNLNPTSQETLISTLTGLTAKIRSNSLDLSLSIPSLDKLAILLLLILTTGLESIKNPPILPTAREFLGAIQDLKLSEIANKGISELLVKLNAYFPIIKIQEEVIQSSPQEHEENLSAPIYEDRHEIEEEEPQRSPPQTYLPSLRIQDEIIQSSSQEHQENPPVYISQKINEIEEQLQENNSQVLQEASQQDLIIGDKMSLEISYEDTEVINQQEYQDQKNDNETPTFYNFGDNEIINLQGREDQKDDNPTPTFYAPQDKIDEQAQECYPHNLTQNLTIKDQIDLEVVSYDDTEVITSPLNHRIDMEENETPKELWDLVPLQFSEIQKQKYCVSILDLQGNFIVMDKNSKGMFEVGLSRDKALNLFDLMIPFSRCYLKKKLGLTIFTSDNTKSKIFSYTIYSKSSFVKYARTLKNFIKKNKDERKEVSARQKFTKEEASLVNESNHLYYKYLQTLTSNAMLVNMAKSSRGLFLYWQEMKTICMQKELFEKVFGAGEEVSKAVVLLITRKAHHIQKFRYDLMEDSDVKIMKMQKSI